MSAGQDLQRQPRRVARVDRHALGAKHAGDFPLGQPGGIVDDCHVHQVIDVGEAVAFQHVGRQPSGNAGGVELLAESLAGLLVAAQTVDDRRALGPDRQGQSGILCADNRANASRDAGGANVSAANSSEPAPTAAEPFATINAVHSTMAICRMQWFLIWCGIAGRFARRSRPALELFYFVDNSLEIVGDFGGRIPFVHADFHPLPAVTGQAAVALGLGRKPAVHVELDAVVFDDAREMCVHAPPTGSRPAAIAGRSARVRRMPNFGRPSLR